MVKEKIVARRSATTLCSIVKKNLCTLGLLPRFFLIGAMVVAVVGETLSSYSEEPLLSRTQSSSERFEKRQFMIPMRDGVLLNTEVYLPKFSSEPVPILLTRTPYGLRHDDDGYHSSLDRAYAELASDGYIFVFQDIRGRYLSDGTFVMLRSQRPANEPMAIDEGTDTYDTIEWSRLLHSDPAGEDSFSARLHPVRCVLSEAGVSGHQVHSLERRPHCDYALKQSTAPG